MKLFNNSNITKDNKQKMYSNDTNIHEFIAGEQGSGMTRYLHNCLNKLKEQNITVFDFIAELEFKNVK